MGTWLLNRSALLAFAVMAVACAGRVAPVVSAGQGTVDMAQLWVDPADLEARDLLYGVGGEALAPSPSARFEFVKVDDGGYSPGFDVRGPDGVMWSTKLGPEAQTEVVVSRILWAIGFHQVPTYYMAAWTMTGGPVAPPGPARFRPELPDRKVVADWSWYENEFLGTQPFKGLLVANVLLNNWDWKTSNNKIYEVQASEGVRREYVVRDLGASLGKTDYPKLLSWLPMRGLGQGSRNDVEDFESQGFIQRADGERVDFFYRGIHASLIETVTRTDVVWTARLLARLSDAQWNDAFRAAGFPPDVAGRYIAKIKSKVAEGLKLAEG
jgi:hypothetical protein